MRKAAAVYGLRAAGGGAWDQVKMTVQRTETRSGVAGGLLLGILGGVLGGPAGAAIGAIAGYFGGREVGHRLGDDPELAGSLKRGRGSIGNCGEWSYAFSTVLDSAAREAGHHIPTVVVFADKTTKPGTHARGYRGTDTAVMVTVMDRKKRRPAHRIYDIFREMLHTRLNNNNNPSNPSHWSNLPPTSAEVTPGKGPSVPWLDGILKRNSRESKPCIKNQNMNVIFTPP